MAMEQPGLLRPVQVRLEQESLQPVQEQCWQRHMQHPILRRQAYRMLEFHRPVRHMLARSTLVRMDHILASGSSTLAALASASSALAMKA
jgi:hypothetical protein